MKSKIIAIKSKSVIRVTLLCGAILLIVSIAINIRDSQSISAFIRAVWKMESEDAQNIDDPPFSKLPKPSTVLPVSEVLSKGKGIPLQFAYNDPDWKRQAYKSYWHSSAGRWSYVPDRIHYAMHRLFVTYPTASVYYDFVHDLGIAIESNSFEIPANNNPFTNIIVVVMQAKVNEIVALGNQVLIIGEPALTGLQVILVPVHDLEPYNTQESILFQLATEKGNEYDNTTLEYTTAPPSRH